MRAVCLQSLRSDRVLQGEEVEVEEAISCLSRFEQTSEREREREGRLLLDSSAELSSAEKERERDDWLTGCQGLKS